MKEDINALNELHKGACMGMDAIDFVLDKVEDKALVKELKREYKDYQTIESKIDKLYPKYSDGDPHSTNAMNKAMTWSSIEFKTMTDNSTSKIAELLLQGVNIASTYVTMQEKSVETLKKFL